MNNQSLSTGQANFKLAIWNAEADSTKSSEVYAQLLGKLDFPKNLPVDYMS